MRPFGRGDTRLLDVEYEDDLENPLDDGGEKRPLITPIKRSRFQEIAELLHLRRARLEATGQPQPANPEAQAPKIETPVSVGGEAKG